MKKKILNRMLIISLYNCRLYEITLPALHSKNMINFTIDSVMGSFSINCSAYTKYNEILEVVEEALSIPKCNFMLVGSVEYHSFDGEHRLCDLGIQNGAILILNVTIDVTIDDTPTVIRSSRCSTGYHLYFQIVCFECFSCYL